MIKLEVQHYCHNCPDFIPDVDQLIDKRDCIDHFSSQHMERIFVDTTIRCKNRHKCECIKLYLETEEKI